MERASGMAGKRQCRDAAALLLLLVCACQLLLRPVSAASPGEVNALQELSKDWNGASLLGWAPGVDVCTWNGVTCSGDAVVSLSLTSAGIVGRLPGQFIAGLPNLETLDLTLMPDLGGPIPPELGQLSKLTLLNLQGCSFSGDIPPQLGNLKNLKFLALNTNKLTGSIPNELGYLSQVYWFDVQQNLLTGELPMSTSSPLGVGMDNLTSALHLHLNNNSLTGRIPPELCSLPKLNHFLLDSNNFGGPIPAAVGNFSALTIMRLQYNNFVGTVPVEISKLSTLTELHLNGNSLTGTIPDLADLKNLLLMDLSDNNFSPQPFPSFIRSMSKLQSLDLSGTRLTGPLPSSVFGLQSLQSLFLSRNALNESVQFGALGPALQYVLLDNNNITNVTAPVPDRLFQEFSLQFNPVCAGGQSGNFPPQWCLSPSARPYVKTAPNCPQTPCKDTRRLNPSNCGCFFALVLIVQLTSPTFTTLDDTRVSDYEGVLAMNTSTQVVVANATFTLNGRLRLETEFFSIDGRDLEFDVANAIVNNFTNQEIGLPGFAPYLVAVPPFPVYPPKSRPGSSSSFGIGAIIGIVAAALIVVLVVVAITYYARRQKKRADKAEEMSKPFASWGGGKTGDSGGAPKLKGARWFSYAELKKATGNFSDSNEIGVGGYGKVYKGKLETGEAVAIKRAQEGSMQGQTEFKNEIELLSRVHHRNLVGLVGFCYEQGEQMLVYEYMPNGTMRDHLVGKGGGSLDWNKRLSIALGSARGLAYLHDLANPPIIHRDIKSSNILLDEKLTAKVADFGLSKLNPDGGGKNHVSTQVKGTLGYLDPEYYMTQQLSDKSDVYSFGVVLLELLTARQPIERGKYIVREVKTALDRGGMPAFRELLDPFLTDYNVHDLKTFLDLALRCVEEAAADRPTMSEVARDLEVLAGHSYADSGHVSVDGTGKSNESFNSQEQQYQNPKPR